MENIYHLVQIKGKVADVHQAVTTKTGLEGWWTNKVTAENGTWRFHFGGDYSKLFSIKEEKDSSVVWECIEAAPEWMETHVSFELAQDGENVVVNFKHSGWGELSPMFGICNYHWALYMKSLKDLVETGKGQPTQIN